MKTLLALVLIAFLVIGGCGGGGSNDGGCDFDILTLANGPNALQADSFWSCFSTRDGNFDFSVFTDGTGLSTFTVFTWEKTGCRSIDVFVDGVFSGQRIFNIEGSFNEGFLTYDDQINDDPIAAVVCDLVLFI